MVNNSRLYGKKPFRVVVVHGGPGTAGEMAPVAKELSQKFGVIEPLQTEGSIRNQVFELKKVIIKKANSPIVLIGYSWGAWLSMIFTSQFPKYIEKLILISSGPFEDKYSKKIMKIRLARLPEDKRNKLRSLFFKLGNAKKNDKNKTFAEIGKIITIADTYNPILLTKNKVNLNYRIYEKVWTEANNLRKSGKLNEYLQKIRCPIIAIHGDYDPHPFQGVQKPLVKYSGNFKFILLKNCGHTPWLERNVYRKFFAVLNEELK